MKSNIKKLLSLALTLCMVLALIPAVTLPASAAVTSFMIGSKILSNPAEDDSGTGGVFITGVSPAFGPEAGGTVVTLTGTGLVAGDTTVKVGGNAATDITVTNATTMTFKTPAGSAGTVDITVTTSAGTATLAGAFTYNAPTFTLMVTDGTGSGRHSRRGCIN